MSVLQTPPPFSRPTNTHTVSRRTHRSQQRVVLTAKIYYSYIGRSAGDKNMSKSGGFLYSA